MEGEVQGGGVLPAVGFLLFVQVVYTTIKLFLMCCMSVSEHVEVYSKCLSVTSTLSLSFNRSTSFTQCSVSAVFECGVSAVCVRCVNVISPLPCS